MSRLHPKNRSPWSTLPEGTRVIRVSDGAPGTVIGVRRKKFQRRYEIDLDIAEFTRERRPDIRPI